MSFDWSGLKLCHSGYPNIVQNPIFTVRNVPAGTKFIRFRLQDKDAPSFEHGGGKIAYVGQSTIKPGAFRYQSPCPPSGRHLYEWTATALSGRYGATLGVARAAKKYP